MSTAEAPAPAAAAGDSKVVPEGFEVRTEGKVSILQRANDVFFNPAQVINRDMSLSVLKYFIAQRETEIESGEARKRFQKAANAGAAGAGAKPAQPGEGVRVLEGLAASGLRAIRYATELEGVWEVVANDLDPSVVESMKRNIAFNGGVAAEKVTTSVGDARLACLQNSYLFDAVDLDPYGSPSKLLDSAVQAVNEGGLLLITATDMAVLCGNHGEACYAKYASYPLHKPYCHEMALRILLASIEQHAARYKRYIVPVLSLSIDFYIRVFVRVYTSAAEVKNVATRLGYVWQSTGCDSFYWQAVGRRTTKGGNSVKYQPGYGPAVSEKCPETGSNFTMGGPFWSQPLHDQEWVAGLLEQIRADKANLPAFDKLHSILTAVSEELPDAPLYFNLHDVCKTLRTTPPRSEVLRSALVNAGYRVSGSHANPLGVKTDAPWSVVWDIMRCWVQQHPVKKPAPGSAAESILAKEPELKADLSRAAQAVSKARQKGVARFLPNPEANWGPKPRHGRPAKQQKHQHGPQQEEQAEQAEQMAEQQAEQRAGDDAAAADGAAADGVAAEQAEAAAEPMQQDGEADGGASEAQA
ncbi:putative tRNA (guanine(26)-N(2))-dimethyltransferase 2 isoform B [Micractinium conductrix]|uniref:tRNA (guanine(26)-N(2))-dimethyltransferase n=1 Tax=Micractinium conductrix TaxID=554055 RepID=A0A2P6V401_9CHLO|nr:putative tRNA (guanine(26)-N(2))-dimethyltransferase 2 isoform B [Micractinium conductrix]|eukprot:PSC68820.1 putative tRNA (guanine(26)-N(2))-dimethyltransferase 2 isoform B [Micractinium conductrix]